jgi:hypothetical protein
MWLKLRISAADILVLACELSAVFESQTSMTVRRLESTLHTRYDRDLNPGRCTDCHLSAIFRKELTAHIEI